MLESIICRRPEAKTSYLKTEADRAINCLCLTLSRLKRLRLFHFKCAWFDRENYFEFYPLHVVYKKKIKKRITSPKDLKFQKDITKKCLPLLDEYSILNI